VGNIKNTALVPPICYIETRPEERGSYKDVSLVLSSGRGDLKGGDLMAARRSGQGNYDLRELTWMIERRRVREIQTFR